MVKFLPKAINAALFFVLFSSLTVNAGSTNNNINICEEATVTGGALNSNNNDVNDNDIAQNHECDNGDCATVTHSLGEAWITLTFDTPVEISTIVFLVDKDDNWDYSSNMLKTYGLSSDRTDIVTNTAVTQYNGSNVASQFADINDGSPAMVQYIHWSTSGYQTFQASEILCYQKKRLFFSDITSVSGQPAWLPTVPSYFQR